MAVVLGLSGRARAYDLPAVNLGSTSFLDGVLPPTGPGLYSMEYFTFYEARRVTDAAGHKLALPSQSVDLFSPVTQFVFAAPQTVLDGAHPGVNVMIPFLARATLDDGLGGRVLRGTTGMGDTVFGPFVVFPPLLREGRPFLAQQVELDAIAPTGRYDRSAAISPGSNFWSLNPFYAATVWATPEWSVSGRFHYLWNATNHSPNAAFGPAARTSQGGQAVHMNLASEYQLDERWGVGVNGYYLQQLDDTRVNGRAVPGRRERVMAIGPGVMFNVSRDCSVALSGYREFLAENRPEGTKVVLRAMIHW